MEAVLFPRGFLDHPDIQAVSTLSSAQKYLWSMCCLHANPAGVAYLSATFMSSLGFVHSVARQLACELHDRGLIAFDEVTNELFVMHWFHWQKTPTGTDKWSRAVESGIGKVKSPELQGVIKKAIENAPSERMEVVSVPSNLISSLRHPTPGKRWEATPALLLLAIYTWPTMGAGGVCVADYEAWSTYISASGTEQIIGHLKDLDRAGNIVFDFETGEVFLPTRLKSANPTWHIQEILDTRSELVSHRVKTNFSRLFTRTFGKNPSKSDRCVPVEFSLLKKSSSEEPAAGFKDSAAAKNQNPSSLCGRLDELRAAGAKTKDCNLEKDRAAIQAIRDIAVWVGDEAVLNSIATANYPGQALKICREAGLDTAAAKAKAAHEMAEAEKSTSDLLRQSSAQVLEAIKKGDQAESAGRAFLEKVAKKKPPEIQNRGAGASPRPFLCPGMIWILDALPGTSPSAIRRFLSGKNASFLLQAKEI